jgi:pimeloyl-ACP methyl ester esterase
MPLVKTPRGAEWFYELSGSGDRRMLFIHGWGVDHRIWKQQIKYFQRHHHVLAVDLPGHGRSGFSGGTLDDMAKELRDVLVHANYAPCHVVGSSFGGLLALKFYELFPGAFLKMTMVGSAPKFARSEEYPYGLDVSRIQKLAGQVETRYPGIVDIFFRSLFTREERASRRYIWMQKFRVRDALRPNRNALLEYLEILEKEDLRSVLSSVALPLHFVNGDGDEICCRDTVQYIRTLAPRARYDDISGCGHFPFLTRPHAFNSVVEDFGKWSV